MNRTIATALLFLTACWSPLQAHDTWVEANTPVVRVGDVVHVDLKLGNHGNGHRDFKLAGRISLDPSTLKIVTPDASNVDVKGNLKATASGTRDGYWSTRFIPEQSGLHSIVHSLDTLHGSTRAIKSAKSYFLAISSLEDLQGGDRYQPHIEGHPLELVLLTDPVRATGPGLPIRVRLLYEGKPLSNTCVTFIPRGQELQAEFDPNFERMTNEDGEAEFTPTEGNLVLAVVHYPVPEKTGPDYDKTHYTATLVLSVPQIPYHAK